MRFSIIVPVYNASKYLDECVGSIIEQTFSDYEVFLVDDGSTDDSGIKCDQYSQIDNRIRVIHKENGGPSSARRAALEQVKGEYILNIDADDRIEESYLNCISQEIELTNADMIAWGYVIINEDGVKRNCVYNIQKDGVYSGKELESVKRRYLVDIDNAEINDGNIIYTTWSKAIKKDIYVYAHNKVPDNIIEGEDAALIWIALKKVKTLSICSIDGYNYRKTQNSIMNSSKIKRKKIESLKSLEKCLLDNCETEDEINRAVLFCYYRVFSMIEYAVQKGYRVYKRFIGNGVKEDLFSLISRMDTKNDTYGTRLRNFFINNRWWLAYYIYSRNRSGKNKFI